MRLIDMRPLNGNNWAPQQPNRLLSGNGYQSPQPSLGNVPFQAQRGLGQAAGCLNPIWPAIGGALVWAFFGNAILGLLGVGKTAATRGVQALQQKVG